MSIETTDEALAYLEEFGKRGHPDVGFRDMVSAARLAAEEIRQRRQEAIEHAEEIRRLTAEVGRLRDAVKAVKVIPRPWMPSANVTWAEWEKAWALIERALASGEESQPEVKPGGEPMSEAVSCWLIEAPAGAWGWATVHWWCGQQEEIPAEWTDQAHLAVRFVRREDAQAALDTLSDWGYGQSARVVEHIFLNLAAGEEPWVG